MEQNQQKLGKEGVEHEIEEQRILKTESTTFTCSKKFIKFKTKIKLPRDATIKFKQTISKWFDIHFGLAVELDHDNSSWYLQ